MNHIVLICDDAYALPTAVTIQSIIKSNTNETQYFIHVCTFGLNQQNTSLIESLSDGFTKVKIETIIIDEFEERLFKIEQKSHVSKSALIKLELANYFLSIDKILYLDSDIIVKNSIDSLFELDISNYYLAASFEFHKYLDSFLYHFGKKDKTFYFNSGVMLLNLNAMRKDSIPSRLWDYKLHHSKTTLMDQECFNEVCKGCILKLSIVYNFNPFFLNKIYLNGINCVYGTSFESINDLEKKAAIVHYVGKADKPWIYRTATLQSLWQQYYDSLNYEQSISLVDFIPKKESLIKKVVSKIKAVGFLSFVSYLFYRKKSL